MLVSTFVTVFRPINDVLFGFTFRYEGPKFLPENECSQVLKKVNHKITDLTFVDKTLILDFVLNFDSKILVVC